jgi:nucleotide sugar dehydrogenase
MSLNVAVIGSGYVGTVVAACLAHVGHDVVALEIDDTKRCVLEEGDAPFHEPGLQPLLRAGLDSGRLRFTGDVDDAVAAAEIIFLCVGTPAGGDGRADIRFLEAAARSIAVTMTERKVLVTKSTVPIGSGQWLQTVVEDAMAQHGAAFVPFAVASNPEFLRQGSAVEDYLHPDRVVLGSDDAAALDVLQELYEPILGQDFDGGDRDQTPTLVRTGLTTAETVKYAANAFLALKISYANEIANVCELVGADVEEVTHAIGLDARIGRRFLDAGIGWGGSCFGKDISELIAAAEDHGYEARILRATLEVNAAQRGLVVRKLRRRLCGLRGRRVGLLGLAFKPETDDLRDAPATDIAHWLVQGGARVVAHDPVVKSLPGVPEVVVVDDCYEVADRADAVVLVTDWAEYHDLDLDELRHRMRGVLFVDGRGVFDPEKVERAGLVFEGIGRAAHTLAR